MLVLNPHLNHLLPFNSPHILNLQENDSYLLLKNVIEHRKQTKLGFRRLFLAYIKQCLCISLFKTEKCFIKIRANV